MRLENKVAVVTGAASGIGRASADLFASEGANILAVDLPGQGLPAGPDSIGTIPTQHPGGHVQGQLGAASLQGASQSRQDRRVVLDDVVADGCHKA